MTVPAFEFHEVSKRYAQSEPDAIHDFSLTAKPGSITTLLGPSGCGKTTALRLLAGLERPDSGTIRLGGRTAADINTWLPPERRGIGMVFQDYALFPHLTVAQNIAFGLPRHQQKQAAAEGLALVGLQGLGKRSPSELSGGQQQRTALARALVRNPIVVLFDEPFSSLDTDLRIKMRQDVAAILRNTQSTAVFVTHDQKEALAISDEIVVLRDGIIQQVGAPRDVYQFPDTAFVASFVGQSNILPGVMGDRNQWVDTDIGPIPCRHTHGALPGEAVTVSIRPESLELDPNGKIRGTLMTITYSGESIDAVLRVQGPGQTHDLLVHIHPEHQVAAGQELSFSVLPHFTAVMRESEPRQPPQR